MSGLVTEVLGGLAGYAVVGGLVGLAALAYSPWTRTWFRRQDDKLQAVIDQVLDEPETLELDHVACAGEDCEQVICACWLVPGQPECEGCTSIGCYHGEEPLCTDCLEQCRECAWEAHSLSAMEAAWGK